MDQVKRNLFREEEETEETLQKEELFDVDEMLSHRIDIPEYYERKVEELGMSTADSVLRKISLFAKRILRDKLTEMHFADTSSVKNSGFTNLDEYLEDSEAYMMLMEELSTKYINAVNDDFIFPFL